MPWRTRGGKNIKSVFKYRERRLEILSLAALISILGKIQEQFTKQSVYST